jgi:hypothetical protein
MDSEARSLWETPETHLKLYEKTHGDGSALAARRYGPLRGRPQAAVNGALDDAVAGSADLADDEKRRAAWA